MAGVRLIAASPRASLWHHGRSRSVLPEWHRWNGTPGKNTGQMNNDLILTLIFAAVAAFVLFKLRSVLGRRTGHEQQRPDVFAEAERSADAAAEGASDNVVQMPDRRRGEVVEIDPDTPVGRGVRAIQAADPGFDPTDFLEGAKAAFEMIVGAFARGERDTLKPLLAPNVYTNFEQAIADREQAGESLETTFIGFKSAKITDAEMQGSNARVTVTFVSEQSNAVRDKDGDVVDGDPAAIEKITDVWTFTRDTKSGDPNWQLVETDGA